MSSQAVIGAQFELQAVPVHAPRPARDVVKEWLREHVKQFVFVRVCIFVGLVFLFACVFYAIEVTTNPIYAVGRNISAHDPNATLAPATGIPTELNFIDALFVSTSMLSNTGLTTVDFSLWSFASQVIGIVTMLVGCLPISSSVPLWVRLMVTRRDGGSKYAEYKALQLVTVVILVYFCFFCIFLSFMFAMTCAVTPAISEVFLSAVPPVNPFFGGYFIAAAAFSNCGFSPLSNSVISLGPFPGIIIWLSFLILVGNIAFPALLRFILGAMHRLGLERRWGLPISLLRRNPRAYFHLLFPTRYVIFLSGLWIFIYLVNWAMVMGLEWSNTMAALAPGAKVTAAIFSSVTNRTAGLNVLVVGNFKGALLVFDVVMFVISASPNHVAVRASRRRKTPQTRTAESNNAKRYTKELLINVVALLTFSWILILLIENGNVWVSTPFPTLFEVASAFGTIGLSMGFGTSNASLSGAYSIPSKIVIIILMICGAHRGVPENADSAIRVREIPTGHVRSVDTEIVLDSKPSHRKFVTKADVSFFGIKSTRSASQ